MAEPRPAFVERADTTQVVFVSAVLFILAAGIIWLAPNPTHAVDMSAAH